MAHKKCSSSAEKGKRLTAQAVHQLASEVLQAGLPLDMDGRDYDAQDIWDVVTVAAVERTTVEMVCMLLDGAPSPNTVRGVLRGLLGGREGLTGLEKRLNRLLVARLPRNLLSQALPCAIDITEVPYHGRHEADDEEVRRERAKSGTTHFHCYATLYTVKHNKRYTLAVTLVRASDKPLEVLKRLLERGLALGLKVKRLLLDRGFDNNAVVAYLMTQPFPTILPLTIRGKTGGSAALLKGRKSHQTTYTRSSTRYGEQTFPVYIVCKYGKGRYRRRGLYRFAYVVIGRLNMPPVQVFEEYRHRFAIESSYRLMNSVRARTASTSPSLRLFYVALALLLLNLWSFVKWCYLYVPNHRGPRQLRHDLLPLTRYRLWLLEVITSRLGLSLQATVPSTA